jgi:hypothetical protein
MALEDFIKRRDGDLDEQEQNFITKLPTVSGTLGIEPAEEASVIAILETHRTSFTAVTTKKDEAKAAVALNNANKSAAIDEFRRIAKKIKSSLNYTTEIGEALGIIGPEVYPPDPASMKPELKAKLSGQNVVIEFNKQSMEGVRIYSKRGAETAFTYLATDTYSPYTDTRAKLDAASPEERQFIAYYFENDSDVGQQSDAVTVVVP